MPLYEKYSRRLYLVKMVASTFMPGRSTRPLVWSIRIFTGMRCTTLTKLPVAFSGGKQAQAAAGGAGDGIHVAAHGSAVHVHFDFGALSGMYSGQLGFLEVRRDPDVLQRNDGHQALAGLDDLTGLDAILRVTTPSTGATRVV